ncbi:aspartic peptidase domain-containing protein [Mycena haematopus]|nr:aspartic peptidase domain-containing protein [Mycena haematopus]
MVSKILLESLGHKEPASQYECEFDLGSSGTWVFGNDVKEKIFGVPGMHDATFWPPVNQKQFAEKPKHVVSYADKSFVEFTTWDARLLVTLSPGTDMRFSGKIEKVPLIVGVAHEASEHFTHSVISGIVGLGRNMRKSDDQNPPLAFLHQIRGRPASPEMTMQMNHKLGAIVFGTRPTDDTGSPWFTDIPVQGGDHWQVESKMRVLDGHQTVNRSNSAIFDTGCGNCYLDDSFVSRLYEKIPSSIINDNGYYVVPRNQAALPQVDLDLGGHLHRLDIVDSHSAIYSRDGIDYRRGVIQPKSLIGWTGGDLIGRVRYSAVLFSLELNLQFPENKDHKLSWRRKAIGFMEIRKDSGI